MIVAYCGLPGSGKTYTLARDCALEMKRGRKVWANFALKGAHYFNDLRQVMNVRKGILAVDEMNTVCPASKRWQLPPEYLRLWTQSRHLGIDLWYTTQKFQRVDNTIRDVTNFCWVFTRTVGKLHRARMFDASDVEAERRKAKPVKKYWFYERKKIYGLYDTNYIIKPPKHLSTGDYEDMDPDELPKFGDDLKLDAPLYQTTYQQDSDGDDGVIYGPVIL